MLATGQGVPRQWIPGSRQKLAGTTLLDPQRFYSRGMEPPFYFVRDKVSKVAHHCDYERDRSTRALCGHEYQGDIVWEGEARPSRVCRACQELLPQFEARWWRQAARKLEIKLERLERSRSPVDQEVHRLRRQCDQLTYQLGLSRKTIETLERKVDNQRKQLHNLQTARAQAKNKPAPKNMPRSKTKAVKISPSPMQPSVTRKGRTSKVSNRFSLVSGGLPGLG